MHMQTYTHTQTLRHTHAHEHTQAHKYPDLTKILWQRLLEPSYRRGLLSPPKIKEGGVSPLPVGWHGKQVSLPGLPWRQQSLYHFTLL